MSTAEASFVEAGAPVEIGQIGKALGQLWEETDDTKTRASLTNLAIYTEDLSSVASNTKLIAEIASEHACRAILVFANPDAPEPQAKAWLNAHCHMVGKDKQICSEQLTFLLEGEMVASMPSVVFSHLDSDLPLYFWRQGEFRKQLNEKLWSRVDRLIFDSADWTNVAEQFVIVRQICNFTEARTVLCDLNWSRLLGTRFALAQIFDHSCALQRIHSIERVTISTPKRLTGLLLLGWLAAQLGWKYQSLLGKESFVSKEGVTVEFEIKEVPGPDVSECVFECADAKFKITHEPHSNFFQVCMSGCDIPEKPMLVAAGKSDFVDILLTELGRGGRHPLYFKALDAIQPLLG